MKKILINYIPLNFIELILSLRQFFDWWKKGFLENSPQLVKQNVFLKYGVKDAIWVETGTYLGTTTKYLSGLFPHVYSIEPEPSLFESARKRFDGQNVTLFNDVSEKVFSSLLPKLRGNINFWLDGHYSVGFTFKGAKDCPVESELAAIEKNFSNFDELTILIDDVRSFLSNEEDYSDYPSVDYLVDWARRMNLMWKIEHDIFIIQKSNF